MPITTSTTVTLNTGAEMPVVGLGTWKSAPGQVEAAVEYALKEAGYKHIDTATAYDNERAVGQGIKASGVPRESFFLTTKLNNNDHERVQEALEYSLEQLDTPYIDLWLMHWPAPMIDPSQGTPDKRLDWLDTWKRMEEVYEKNRDKVRAIGVSNFSVPYLNRLLKVAKVVPAVNQIELHPSLPQQEVVDRSAKAGIVVTSYSPLGSDRSPLLTDPTILKVAKKYDVEPAAILISFQAIQPNRTVLPKSVTPARIKSNVNLVDLTPEEVQEIKNISKTSVFRVCAPQWTGWGDLGFPTDTEALGVESSV
ncbi:hypothetical protein BOTBODRAFT_345685 [Botryobasidium botryosum FD-172 SS1]|uniref:NADP-dependent oxidoreductase domain-containing protein n=1 Tax=Botryobasidium botryosum (strain FD-172 SS1) TaxID=930990 RepID=A0A067MIJ4_BOTB1|nr:hypothetical protein BOTBODRAFT_345685 [Botryobasidium botryosum FD-172 SS1]